jgi:hypothetical protein
MGPIHHFARQNRRIIYKCENLFTSVEIFFISVQIFFHKCGNLFTSVQIFLYVWKSFYKCANIFVYTSMQILFTSVQIFYLQVYNLFKLIFLAAAGSINGQERAVVGRVRLRGGEAEDPRVHAGRQVVINSEGHS